MPQQCFAAVLLFTPSPGAHSNESVLNKRRRRLGPLAGATKKELLWS